MKKKKVRSILPWAVAGLGLMVSLSSCRQTYDEEWEIKEQFVVGVVCKSSTSEYWMTVISGMEAAAAKENMELIFLAPDLESDREVQEKQIEKLVEQNVDALAISPIDSYYTPDYIKKIEEKEIPVIAFDTGFGQWEVPYIGIDNYKTGYELGKTLAEQLGHTGQVGIVAGDLKQMAHKDRARGFIDYIHTEQEMTLAFMESGYGNLQMSEQEVQLLKKEHPRVKGILATSAVTALGLADEMKEQGVRIVSVDEQVDSLEALDQGKISALAVQSGYQIGYETISTIKELCMGKEARRINNLEARILTADNLEEYRRNHENEKQCKK